MSIFDFFRRKRETRAADPSWTALSNLSGMNTATGAMMNPKAQEQLAVCAACIEVISSGVAALPVYVYSSSDKGRTLVERHPLMRLVRRGPNGWQSWFEFMHSVMRQALIFGNALVEPQWDASGRLVGLKLVPWWCVSVQLLPSGRLAYDITDIVTAYGGTGRQRRLFGDEVVHLKDATDDGLVGRSRLARAGYVFAAALGVQEMAAALYKNSANPSGVVSTELKLNPEAFKGLADSFRDVYGGASNTGKVVVLDQGLKWSQMSINPEDAELLDSRRFAGEEMARLFQVPPPLVGIWDHSSFTNSETAGRWFAQHTLRAWIGRLESEMARKLFSEATAMSHEIEFDLSALLRGDPETRWKSHEIAVRNGILSPDEVRAEEGWNPRPEGQQAQTQQGEA